MNHHYLSPLFAPASVAVVGAGERAGSLGHAVFSNLIEGGFAGRLDAVNPKYTQVLGRPCHADLASLPERPDLVVIVTPAQAVASVLEDMIRAGLHYAVVLTAGFSEAGAEGQARQAKMLDIARRGAIRLIGPNCLGLMRPSIGVNATFARGSARPGPIALISQSGAICAALVDWAWAAGIGFSSVVSTGAGADLDFGEILDYLVHDAQTRSILIYVEGVHDARRFISGLRAAARTKPIIVMKVGRHAAGSRAALSHTGALVGNDAVFDAALSRCGVVRVATYAELFSAARLLGAGRLPQGNRLAILTNGGGPGVMAADCAAENNVELATLAPATVDALNAVLPPHWSHGNPVDIIGDATAQRFEQALAPLLADPGVDGVLTLFCPQIVTSSAQAAQVMLDLGRASPKPLLTGWLGETEVKAGRALIEAAGMPAFINPESGVTGFAALAQYRHAQALLLEAPPHAASSAAADLEAAFALARDIAATGRTQLTEPESKQLLGYFGIPTPRTVVARTLEEALAVGRELGFPLALKILSPDISHKSDVQGVTLNVRDAAGLEREFGALLERVAKLRPDARLDGVAVQQMIEKRFGRELLVGVAHDPVFGSVLSFGAGGVAVELLKDNAIGLPPLNRRLAAELIDRTRIARLLGSYRHIPAASRESIIDVLLKVSEMACALPWLAEMDINPLLADNEGAIALDARVVIDPARLRPDPHYTHLAIHPYPAGLAGHATLRDGQSVLVRPIRPEDADIEEEFVERLSEESRRMRFFSAARGLPPELLSRLTQVDYERELALLATVDSGRGERIVGVARYAPEPDGTSCEFAITVADDWQRLGLGSLLMHRLIEAARGAGYQAMAGEVLAANHPMQGLALALGFKSVADDPDPLLVRYEMRLSGPAVPGAALTAVAG